MKTLIQPDGRPEKIDFIYLKFSSLYQPHEDSKTKPKKLNTTIQLHLFSIQYQ
jgi:hypothetical protein